MERSFTKEIELLKLGEGEVFRGEGILAVTKALLQSGVAYVGGYQGAPVSHLLDVLTQAKGLMGELGVSVEANSNEASAAAMLAASIAYPVRGCVTWKSIVGTNVASDALSNLASPGVMGGALIILGEDYGEGASIIQERSHAMAMKSTMWLMDPRPDLETIVRTVEHGFELSEASNAPVMVELRIRACHVQGEFIAKDNKRPALSALNKGEPANFLYDRLSHPPATFMQEKKKVEQRLPAAQKYIVEHRLNEHFAGAAKNVGIILQGGLYNGLVNALEKLGLADIYGATQVPLFVLNVVHPLVPEEIAGFCAGKDAVLVVEEGNPEFIEHQINTILRRADLQTKVFGKNVLPMAGDYTVEVIMRGLTDFLGETEPQGANVDLARDRMAQHLSLKETAAKALDQPIPPRPPGFCVGCPERPVFAAIKILKEEIGDIHISTDIGCHSFATFPPFSLGNHILGYGMSLAASAGVAPMQKKRVISIMGDGGFWHNGLQSGVMSALFNQGDRVLIIMQNGYSSATGQQSIPSSHLTPGTPAMTAEIERTLKAVGVKWIRTVRTYSVDTMVQTLRDAMTTKEAGLKVIIADGECMLARQRRLKAENAHRLQRNEEVTTPRFGVDDEICTGDHSCIRLSGCPSLTLKPSPDPLRTDPVAHVNEGCLGCGLCGEVAHAAQLCPSFYQAERTQHANLAQRLVAGMRRGIIGLFAN